MIVFASTRLIGYIIIIVVIVSLCVGAYMIRRKFKIGTYTKEEESHMKSNLDLLIKEEEIEEGKDYKDEV